MTISKLSDVQLVERFHYLWDSLCDLEEEVKRRDHIHCHIIKEEKGRGHHGPVYDLKEYSVRFWEHKQL